MTHDLPRVDSGFTGKKRVMIVYGTRPEAIKVAPVIQALRDSDTLEPVCVVTGQHREMLDQVNRVFDIEPDFDLNLFSNGQTLNKLAGRIFADLDPVLERFAPDAVLVQGDTTTVMASAIAAFYRQVPVVHLEAGLRSHNLYSPFPEEANRKLVSQVSALHLAPTPTSKFNLEAEGIPATDIVVTGNTGIDSLVHIVSKSVPWSQDVLQAAVDTGKRILLATTHRRENWGGVMEGVGRALRRIAEKYPDDIVILPAHRNPVVRKSILPQIADLPNVVVCEPLPYQEFAQLLNRCHFVLTDSGGIQEEAPTLGKPVLVLRENTERPEAVEAGTVKLIGTDEERIVEEVSALKEAPAIYKAMAKAANPYGDGNASIRSLAAIEELLGVGKRISDFEPLVRRIE